MSEAAAKVLSLLSELLKRRAASEAIASYCAKVKLNLIVRDSFHFIAIQTKKKQPSQSTKSKTMNRSE